MSDLISSDLDADMKNSWRTDRNELLGTKKKLKVAA
jgi:hypothetical protein